MIQYIRTLGPTKLILAAVDILVLISVALVILMVRHYWSGYPVDLDELVFFAVSAGAAVLVLREFRLYRHKLFFTGSDQVIMLAKAMLWVGILQIFVIFLIKDTATLDYSRINVLLFGVSGWLALILFRVGIFRKLYSKIIASKPIARHILIIGAGESAQSLASQIHGTPELGLRLAGFIDDDPEKQGLRIFGIPIIGPIAHIDRLAKEMKADEIFVAINAVAYSRLLEIIEACRRTNLPVTITANHFRIIPDKIGTSEFPFIESLTLRPSRREFPHRTMKELIDRTGAAMLLLLLAPLLLTIALAVKLSSKGPVLYHTKVVGKNGKLFTWYKFRTMIVNRDEDLHRKYVEQLIKDNASTKKLERDPRITKAGAVLRKYSLDELPQLLNVLRGEMSLIGPRPCLPYEYKHFAEWHRGRFAITPGITGLWQIFGRNRKDVTFNDSIILDLYYIQNYSLWLDAKILLKTIPVVLFGRGGA